MAPKPAPPAVDEPADGAVTVVDCELCIVLPCLNEAETLGVCVDKAIGSLRRMQIVGEVVVADNGSTDGSQEIARAAGARVVEVARRGYGAALEGGIEAARARYVLIADADDSYALDDIGPFLEQLRARTSSWATAFGAVSSQEPCPSCIGDWATRSCRGSAGCSSMFRSAISTVACGPSGGTRSWPSACVRREWSLPAK